MSDTLPALTMPRLEWLPALAPCGPEWQRRVEAKDRRFQIAAPHALDPALLAALVKRTNAQPIDFGAQTAPPGTVILQHAAQIGREYRPEIGAAHSPFVFDTDQVSMFGHLLLFRWRAFVGPCEDGQERPITWNRAWREETSRYELLHLLNPDEVFSASPHGARHLKAAWSEGKEDEVRLFPLADFAPLLAALAPPTLRLAA